MNDLNSVVVYWCLVFVFVCGEVTAGFFFCFVCAAA
jgi:hypothetical protein